MIIVHVSLNDRFEALARPPASIVTRYKRYSVISTPTKPEYTYGNLICLDTHPQPGYLRSGVLLWQDHFAATRSTRATIAFEEKPMVAPTGLLAEAASLGLEVHVSDVLRLSQPSLCPSSSGPECRPITSSSEWEWLLEDSATDNDFGIPDLQSWLIRERRKLVRRGRGTWWGLFYNRMLIGSCGAFFDNYRVRFEQLRITPRYRRMGFGMYMLSWLTSFYRQRQIVIEAEHASYLSNAYQRVGYHVVALRIILCLPLAPERVDS